MIRITCNRCGKEIKGTTYYTIDIRGKDVNNTRYDYDTGSCSASTAMTNIQAAFESIYGQKHYCEECIKEVRDFIANKEKSNI